jgi:hypothetical protein
MNVLQLSGVFIIPLHLAGYMQAENRFIQPAGAKSILCLFPFMPVQLFQTQLCHGTIAVKYLYCF